MLHYSVPVMKESIDEVKVVLLRYLNLSIFTDIDFVMQALGDKLREKDKDAMITFNVEPFDHDIFTHGAPSAYPPDRSRTILPSALIIAWNDKDIDQYVYDSIRNLSASLLETAIKDGQDLTNAVPYTNYAVYGTPVKKIYGKNVARLREIKEKYDPFRVMDLTGGFKF
jgi:hypothetical protein